MLITGSLRGTLILMIARSVLGSCETRVPMYSCLVGQRDLDLLHAVDDVVIGQDVAALVDDDAGAHAVDVLRLAAAKAFFARAEGLLAVDVDDRRPSLLDELDGRGATHFRAVSRIRRRPGENAHRNAIHNTARNGIGQTGEQIGGTWRGCVRLDGRGGRRAGRVARPPVARGLPHADL